LGLFCIDGGIVSVFGFDFWCEVVVIYCWLVYVFGDVVLWFNFLGGEIIDMLLWMCDVDLVILCCEELLECF